jgi:hypothetical protein
VDHHVLFLVSVGQLVLLVHYFVHKGPSRNRFGLRPGSGSLDGGAHLRRFMRSRASPAAHAHVRMSAVHAREVCITGGASACAHRRRRTRTLIAFGSCARVQRTRTLIDCGSCAHVQRPSPAAHAHACIHVGGRGRSHISIQACQPFGAAEAFADVEPLRTVALPAELPADFVDDPPAPKVTEASSCGFAESVNMRR